MNYKFKDLEEMAKYFEALADDYRLLKQKRGKRESKVLDAKAECFDYASHVVSHTILEDTK